MSGAGWRASQSSASAKRRLARGFTILEVMIVLVIIGLVLSLVGPQLFGQLGRAKSQIAETQIKILRGALEAYYLDMQRYPTTAEGLAGLRVPAAGAKAHLWAGPYLQDEVPLDPWGNSYVYRAGETRDRPFFLFSLGADGKEGGSGSDRDIGILPAAPK